MARKKSKKKEGGKKKSAKKILLKLKAKENKRSKKKKKAGKKTAEKKKEGKKAQKKNEGKKSVKVTREVKEAGSEILTKPETKLKQNGESSSGYNVQNAVAKLRTLKTKEEILAFTKGEKRVTVTRAIQAAIKKLG